MGIVSQFHLPCVRAFYDGSNVYMTPSCISAHLTYMNIDYKYVSGSTDILEIINKYRMRGFGTWLNKQEIENLLDYSSNDPFWKNLYGNATNAISMNGKNVVNVGCLPLDHKIFHPRLINMDSYYDAEPINTDMEYNNHYNGETIRSLDDYEKEINKYFYSNVCNNINTINLCVIDTNGNVKPLEKYIIETYYNNMMSDIFKPKNTFPLKNPDSNNKYKQLYTNKSSLDTSGNIYNNTYNNANSITVLDISGNTYSNANSISNLDISGNNH
jgi:hypothetical protein